MKKYWIAAAALCLLTGCTEPIPSNSEAPAVQTGTTAAETTETAASSVTTKALQTETAVSGSGTAQDDPTAHKYWEQGYEEGEKAGYEAGFEKGHAKGLEEGEAQQKAAGETAEQTAYDEGFKEGQDAGKGSEVSISGSFTASVRALLPDYVRDGGTIQAAVLQIGQSEPFFMTLSQDLCAKMQNGGTYVFEVQNQTVFAEPALLQDNGILGSEILRRRNIAVADVRAPLDGETGANANRLTYQKQ